MAGSLVVAPVQLLTVLTTGDHTCGKLMVFRGVCFGSACLGSKKAFQHFTNFSTWQTQHFRTYCLNLYQFVNC